MPSFEKPAILEQRPENPEFIPSRTRVTNRLVDAGAYPFALVIAPAGFGKTTAIRRVLAQTKSAILVETPKATTLEQFILAFARACSRVIPELASPPHEPVSKTADANNTADLYSAWAVAHLRQTNCTIAIDDLQNADDDPSVILFLIRTAEATRATTKWIFSSRNSGSLPTNRWQAYGDSDAPISADDLRMTAEEALSYAKSLGSSLSVDQVAPWVEHTCGFPVAIAYAIRLSARGQSVERIIDGTREFTFTFLAEQLWSSLPPDERTLLETAAYLPALHVHAYEIGGLKGSSLITSRLCNDIAFMSQLGGLFSMHDLFRDFIKQQLIVSGLGIQRLRVSTAIAILLRAGRYNEAFELLIESCSTKELLEAIERHPIASLDFNVTRRIVEAIDHLHAADLGNRTLYMQIEHFSWIGDARRARQCAEEMIRREDATSSELLCAVCAMFKLLNYRSAHEHRDWLTALIPILGRLNDFDRVQVNAYRASLLARFPENQQECRSLIQEVQAQVNHLQPIARIDSLIAIGSALSYLREIDATLSSYREAAEVARSSSDARQFVRALNNYGLMLCNYYDSEVETLFEPLREAVERTGAWRFSHVSHWLPTKYFALRGDLGAALREKERQLAIIVAEEPQQLNSLRRHSANLIALLGGDYTSVTSSFRKFPFPKELDYAYELLTDTAAAFALSGDTNQCFVILQRSNELRLSLSPIALHGIRDAFFVEVIAAGASGRWAHAKRLWQKYTKVFPDSALHKALDLFCEGPPFVGLDGALGSCFGEPFIGLAALLMKRIAERETLLTPSPLTPAEAAVLRLLAFGRSNKEIASVRRRSEETVKRQVASLFRKLEVENRTSAAAVARERGLI